MLTSPNEINSKKGILSLIGQGFIPPGVQLELDPPPIKSSLIPTALNTDKRRDTAFKGYDLPAIQML